MPGATPQAVRKQLAQGKPDPVYVIVGDDEAEMSRLAAEVSALVEDELRAFNLERMYAGEKGAAPADIVESARTLPTRRRGACSETRRSRVKTRAACGSGHRS